MTALDPTLHMALRLALALLFGSAAWHKLRDPAGFTASLKDYRLLPPALSAPAAALLVGAEAATAGLLLLPAADPAGPAAALALLSLYTAAIAWNLARGRRHIDCGCAGPGRRQPLSAWLVARNAGLGAGAWLLLAGVATRPTTWVDALSLLGSVVLCVLLWRAAHRLGALRATAPPSTRRSLGWTP